MTANAQLRYDVLNLIVGEQIVAAPFRVAYIAVLFDCIHRSTPWGGLANGHPNIRGCGHHCRSCWRLRDETRETSIGERLISCSWRDPTRLEIQHRPTACNGITLVVTQARHRVTGWHGLR